MAEERIQRHYITRINRETGEITYINYERHDELPRARTTIDDVTGYEDRAIATGSCADMNRQSGRINGRYEYFDTRRDENTFPNLNNLSDEAKKWFAPEEAPEEEEETEESE